MISDDDNILSEIGSGNVFQDFGLPDSQESQFKSDVALLIRRIIEEESLSQVAAAQKMGVTQPEVSHIMNAKISKFSAAKLLSMLTHLGRNLSILVEKSENEVGEMHLTCA